jgi:hypothetical protein
MEDKSAEKMAQWFADNLNLIERFSWKPVLFIVEYQDNNWRVGYARCEDEGLAFFDNLVGFGTELTTALRFSYEESVPLVAKIQRVVDSWKCIAPKQLRVGNRVLRYWLDLNGEFRETTGEIVGRSADQVKIADIDGEFSYYLYELTQCWQKL